VWNSPRREKKEHAKKPNRVKTGKLSKSKPSSMFDTGRIHEIKIAITFFKTSKDMEELGEAVKGQERLTPGSRPDRPGSSEADERNGK